MRLRICEFLRPIDLFKALTPRQLTDVAEHMTKRHFAAGETIIREGEPRRGVLPDLGR